ncbi:MAG TPA: hypothetical protein VNW73_16550 [Ktedonobacteraceae bacterium]|nr:hypothetical protein [Ktedonobacteraceae bacterium]
MIIIEALHEEASPAGSLRHWSVTVADVAQPFSEREEANLSHQSRALLL